MERSERGFAISGAADSTLLRGVGHWGERTLPACASRALGGPITALALRTADGCRALSSGGDPLITASGFGMCSRVAVFKCSKAMSITYRSWHLAQIRNICPFRKEYEPGTLRLWDVEKGHCLCVLEGQKAGFAGVAWSQDGAPCLFWRQAG